MKVEIKKDETEIEAETGPGEGTEETNGTEPTPTEVDRVRQLELENAELRGRASALQSVAKPSESAQSQNQWQAVVLADMNTLSDDDFIAKYKYPKYQATAAILEQKLHDVKQEQAATKADQQVTKIESRLAAKYGKDFYDVKSDVDEMVSVLSPEVKQDPEKLARFMERAYLAASKDKKTPSLLINKGEEKPKGEGVKRIVSSFEKPTPTPQGGSRKEANQDEVPEEFRSLAKSFKITSEKERQDLMKDNFVPVDFGAGLVFRDPEKGVEKVA